MRGIADLRVTIPQTTQIYTPSKGARNPPLSPTSPTAGASFDVESQRRESLRRRLDEARLSGEGFALLVIEGLADAWSVIRGDTAKVLVGLSGDDATALVEELTSNLRLNASSSQSWQILHGTLLGLLPLLGEATTEQRRFVQGSCLALQRHSRLPVREAARSCFGELLCLLPGGLSDSTALVLQLISDILEADGSTIWRFGGEERATPRANLDTSYCLDGLLCCIGVIINASTNADDILPAEKTILIISRCLGDSSSTVRQSAGQNLILLLRKFNEFGSKLPLSSNASCAACKRLVYEAIVRQFDDLSADKWPQHEASLLVCEDIIRSTTIELLEKSTLAGSSLPTSSSSDGDMSSFVRVLETLQHILEISLEHGMFEMRRVGAQLLPPLLRAIVLFAPEILLHRRGEKVTAESKMHDEGDMQFSLFSCVLISEVSKVLQHVREVLLDIDETVAPFGHRWALEVQGRHMEDENRVAFHLALRSLCTIANASAAEKEKQRAFLKNIAHVVSTFLILKMGKVTSESKSRVGSLVYSCDFIEAHALYSAVVAAEEERDDFQWIESLCYLGKMARTRNFNLAENGTNVRLLPSLLDPSSSDSKKSVAMAFVSANRWACEAVAPVVSVLVGNNYPAPTIFSFSLVVAQWISKSISDPLWLDRRPAVRRGLLEALPYLLDKARSSCRTVEYFEKALEISTIVEEAFELIRAVRSSNKQRKWDTNELHQVLKLIQASGVLLDMLRRHAEETTELTIPRRTAELIKTLRLMRECLVYSQQPKCAPTPQLLLQEPARPAPQLVDEEDDLLDAYSDWDEESLNEGEMSASESGLLGAEGILNVVLEIDGLVGE